MGDSSVNALRPFAPLAVGVVFWDCSDSKRSLKLASRRGSGFTFRAELDGLFSASLVLSCLETCLTWNLIVLISDVNVAIILFLAIATTLVSVVKLLVLGLDVRICA